MKCSVLLPVYNAGCYLRTAIESILSQDESDFELIVLDDCSTDGSAETIRAYERKDSRLRGVFHTRNLGVAATLNEGLQLARSDLVVRMDHDDEALPNRLRVSTRFMMTRPEVAVAGSYVYHMGRTTEYDHLIELPTEHEEISIILLERNCIYHPSVIMRRSMVVAVGGYREEFRNAEDYDLWLRLCRRYRVANIPIPLLRYRFSSGGMTLGCKWQQMQYVQMALCADRDPTLSAEALHKAAAAALARLNQGDYLEQVAIGTIRELACLGRWIDMYKVCMIFSRQLSVGRSAKLFREMARCASAQLLYRMALTATRL